MPTEYSPSKAIQVTKEVIDMKYVDRGDPATPDFTEATLTIDGNWHELDLSGIVPEAGANHLVHLIVNIAVGTLAFREIGNVNTENKATTGYVGISSDLWVMMNATRKIEYSAPPGTLGTITVRGWWTD